MYLGSRDEALAKIDEHYKKHLASTVKFTSLEIIEK